MTILLEEIQPKKYCLVQQLNVISTLDQKIITLLYQPIIGPKATSLYLHLITELELEKTKRFQYKDIFNMLQIGPRDFYNARIRLEAIGLLQTYYTKEENLETFVYELMPPASVYMFFQNKLYTSLLIEQVGEEKFESLRRYFIIEKVDLSKYYNVSKRFSDIFGKFLPEHQMKDATIIGNQRGELQLNESTFDWVFFNQLMTGSYLNEKHLTIQVKQAIQTLHQLYGIDPLEMKQYVLQAHDIITDQINSDKLYQIVRDDYLKIPAQSREESTQPLQTIAETNDVDFLFINSCEKMSPYDFLALLKKQANSFVTKSDVSVLETLMTKSTLKPAVINVLIHYILVVRENSSLSRSLAEKISADWQKAELSDAKQAIDYVRNRSEQFRKQKEQKIATKRGIKQVRMSEEEKAALNGTSTEIDNEEWQSYIKMFE